MLRQLRPAVPPPMTVIVLADRGLDARWLFRRLVRLGWHPFLRIKTGGTFRAAGHNRFQPLRRGFPLSGRKGRGLAAPGPFQLGDLRLQGPDRFLQRRYLAGLFDHALHQRGPTEPCICLCFTHSL